MAQFERTWQQVAGDGIVYQSHRQAYTAPLQETDGGPSAFQPRLPQVACKAGESVGAPLSIHTAWAVDIGYRGVSSFHPGARVTLTQRLVHYEKLMRLDKPI